MEQLQQLLDAPDENLRESLAQCLEFAKGEWLANNDLVEQQESQRIKYDNKIEALEHSKYQLETQLEELQKLYTQSLKDIENDNTQLKEQFAKQSKENQTQQKRIVCLEKELSMQRESAQDDLERQRSRNQELANQFSEREREAGKMKDDIQQLHAHYQNSSKAEQKQLQEVFEAFNLTNQRLQETEILVSDLQSQNENLHNDISRLNIRITHVDAEIAEKTEENETLMQALDDSRNALQQTKLQARTINDEIKKDKSIFNEVEDRRLDMRAEYIKLKNQYDSLALAHENLKRQWHRVRNQVSNLLQAGSRNADSNKVSYLESALSQKESEISKLKKRIQELEEEGSLGTQMKGSNFSSQPHHQNKLTDDEVAQFLERKCQRLQKEMKEISQELYTTQLMVISETTKYKEASAKIYRLETEKDRSIAEVMKLKMKLNESTTTHISSTITAKSADALDNRFIEKLTKTRQDIYKKEDKDFRSKASGRFPLSNINNN